MTAPHAPQADLGLLIVHGIGQQRPGETLHYAAMPLLKALTRWLPHDGPLLHWREALLKPAARGSGDPAHALVEVTAADRPARRVLLAECCWAEEFDPPAFPDLARTLAGAGAWLALRAVATLLLAPVRWLLGRYRLPWPVLLPLALVLGPLAGLVVGTLQLAVLALLVFSLLPLPGVRRRVVDLTLTLSDVLGDSQLFAQDPLMHEAVQSRLRHDLNWLRRRAKRCVLIAASQGSAIALNATLDDPERGTLYLVTLGSAVRKLAELKATADGSLTPPLALKALPLLALGLLLVVLASALGLASLGPADVLDLTRLATIAWFAGLVYLGLTTALFYAAAARGTEVEDGLRPLLARWLEGGGAWLDLYATFDFVPHGPLLRGAPPLPNLVSIPVVNRLSPFLDHVTYFEGGDDALARLAAAVDRWTGWGWQPAGIEAALGPMSALRAARQALRLAGSLSCYTAFLLAAFLLPLPWRAWLGGLLPAGVDVRQAGVPGVVQDATAVIAEIALAYPPWLLSLLPFLLAAWLYERCAVRPLWRAFDRRAARHLPWDLGERIGRAALVGGMLLLAFLPWEGLAAALKRGTLAAIRPGDLLDAGLALPLAGLSFLLAALIGLGLAEHRMLRRHPELALARQSEPDRALARGR